MGGVKLLCNSYASQEFPLVLPKPIALALMIPPVSGLSEEAFVPVVAQWCYYITLW
jgi:hypothetical protein